MVSCQLGTAIKRQTIHDNFQAPVVPCPGSPRSMLRTNKLAATRPPASLQTLAAALSKANPLLPNTPVLERMLDFGQFDFGQLDFGQLAEVEIGRSRNWPKSKLAEVEINWPKSNRWCLLCFSLSLFFFLCFVFTFLYFFSCSCSSLSSFCFCAVSVFVPKNLN